MKQAMKSLKHNGIYVPPYDYKGFSIKIEDQKIKLTPESEQMAIAWIRKKQSTLSPPDKVFEKNFMQEFVEQLKQQNPSLLFLKNEEDQPIDFSEVTCYLDAERQKKERISKERKKKLAADRKAVRLKRKEKYGYAEVNGKKLEIANWTAEPSCLFAGRGDHPRRGKWKKGPGEDDIILNLSPDSPRPAGNWKEVVWEPDKMYVAKWTDKLTGKIKYVWFSDTAFIKQNREKEKFKKAEKLGKNIAAIEKHILKNLDAEDETKRKVATVCWLILKPNMRVGDEKDPDESR
jgi:DNA topoisomerase-1